MPSAIIPSMADVTQILSRIELGDPSAADQLLPLVYDEMRRLAAAKMASEKPGHTLQATALVHDAYLRLVDGPGRADWNGRGHFFAAAAEAMRRILVENARRKGAIKHGGDLQRLELEDDRYLVPDECENLLALDEALAALATVDSDAAELVKLRYFAGLTNEDAARLLGISPRKANFLWLFARTWLRRKIGDS